VSIRFAAVSLGLLVSACGPRPPMELGFWFEPVSFTSPRLGAPVSAEELAGIERLARAEVMKAFQDFDLTLTDNRKARFKVTVVQQLTDGRMLRRRVDVAGQSRVLAGFGGSGAVSFYFVASGATVHSPETADRATILEALGRAIGRTAVHEFAHQLAPRTPIHDSRVPNSYENGTASAAQYFGEMHWDIARPELERRFKRKDTR
jgi:hypothetical protein